MQRVATTHNMEIEAIKNIKKICDENLAGRYQLDVVDTYQQPDRGSARPGGSRSDAGEVPAAPLRRLIGSLSNTGQVLRTLAR